MKREQDRGFLSENRGKARDKEAGKLSFKTCRVAAPYPFSSFIRFALFFVLFS